MCNVFHIYYVWTFHIFFVWFHYTLWQTFWTSILDIPINLSYHAFTKTFFLTGRMKTLYGFINGLWKPLIYSDGLRCFLLSYYTFLRVVLRKLLFWLEITLWFCWLFWQTLTRSAQLSINETLHVEAKLFALKRWYFLRYFVGLLCFFWIKKHKRVGLPYL